MKGIILHGGKGTRLRPLTHTGPKQLIPIANKPMSQYALEYLREAEIRDIAIILGDLAPDKTIDYYGDGTKFGVKITYIRQDEARGIAHAVGLTREFVGDDSFTVCLGDNLLRNGITHLVRSFASSDAVAQIALSHVSNPEAFGVAELDSAGKIIRLIEKPKVPPSDLALVGVYIFRRPIFDAIDGLKPSRRGELEITEAIQRLIEMGLPVRSEVISGWWKDTGKPEDILEANQLVLSDLDTMNKGRLEEGVEVTGRIAVGEGTIIRAKSILRGPLIIGTDCEIGPETYLGPYTSIGNDVVIKRSEIENSIVLDHTIIECETRIVDSLIGRGSKVISHERGLPKGYKLVIGENTVIKF